jgi:hypothetical protein
MYQDLNPYLKALLGENELVEQWWSSPNKAFDGKCPKDVEYDAVEQYVMECCFGK